MLSCAPDLSTMEAYGKVTKAEDGLKKLLESVEKGETGSRSERDEKIGHIRRKYKVTG
jgi:hypothetical protein